MSIEAIEHISNKRILFSPLNWGFGHVSRSIPILQKLIDNGNSVIVACNENQRKVYEEYFSNLEFVIWEGYPFRFSGKGNFALDLFRSLPNLISFGRKEMNFVERFCQTVNVDLVISDHRYFFRSKKIKSIFITHQITLPLPAYLKFAQRIHLQMINKFIEIWILDTKEHSFAGKLSEGKTKPKQVFLGPVSRFRECEDIQKSGTLILISGPEPYANKFYLEQKSKLKQNDKIVYNGKMETLNSSKELRWKDLDEEMIRTKKLVSRSGYSTLMDVHFLKCDSEFIPTKGQWEQEYLKNLPNE
mgnify:CR=1 FL=1|jgi:uncharacterized protein (TIGR00661 family)|tara:strand:- start:6738 stop:7643 length:906 start_codon:yes stop_codon:yes gene_type:complete